jgi:hypothetical protein
LYEGTLFSNPGIRNRMGEMFGGFSIFNNQRYENIRHRFWNIKIGKLCNEHGIIEKREVEHMLGVPITEVEYGKLRSGIKFIVGKFKPS